MFLPKNGSKVIADTCVMALTLALHYSAAVEWCLLPSAWPNVQLH